VDVLELFHPLIADWFRERFGRPTAPQIEGWPRIAARESTLIAAPTGSGKTLAAFLGCLDRLVREGLRAPLGDRTRILYVSPLKALSNDVQKNLQAPLAELRERACRDGIKFPEINVAVRTGDTPLAERAKMAKRPPHVLVTTPESLYILLTSEKGRAGLGSVDTVIVDEIHAIAGDKRGAHLALTLERLERLCAQATGRAPVRVGLSATQKPIERVARLLAGTRRALPYIVDGGHARHLDLAIEITDDELGAVASNEQLGRVYDRIVEMIGEHRTTLVFTNTRRMVERVAAALERRLGEDQVVAHHGSMSRQMRLAAEEKLKTGVVKVAVATASLELGIDVGVVDLVVQIGSPRAIATLLQRVGRSGHSLGATPKGRLFALTRDQLIECASLVRAVRRGNLDELKLRDWPLDILSQQIVAMCACEEVREDELFELVTGAAPYADLPRAQHDAIVAMLAEGVSDRRGRAGAHLHRDRTTSTLRGRRGARLAAITSGGAIPDNANYAVIQWPDEIKVGEIEEDFAIESSAGDIFQLGNREWRIRRVEGGKVIVEDASGQPPTIPFWLGEAPARTRELSDEVSALRTEIDRRLAAGEALDEIAAWLAIEVSMAPRAAAQAIGYLAAGRAALGALPTANVVIAERFFDEGGGMQLVLHSPLGGRINRAWGLALRKKFCRSFDFELQAAATDDGIVISLGQPHSFPLASVFGFLSATQTEDTLVQALLDRPMFEVRWRWNVTRSLAVLRRSAGKKIAPQLLKMRAADTLSVVFPQAQACQENVPGDREIPDHPLVFETIRDCLVEAMDVRGLEQLIERIERGEIQVLARDTVEPSVLCHELINANPYAFLDDAPLEERRTRAVNLRRTAAAELADAATALDPAAIAAAEDEVRPVARDRDELHDALLAMWLVPEPQAHGLASEAAHWLGELAAGGRAVRLEWAERASWVATERLAAVLGAVPACVRSPDAVIPGWSPAMEPEQAMIRIVAGQLDHGGPRSARALADQLGLDLTAVIGALLWLEGDGAILRGSFTGRSPDGSVTTRSPDGSRSAGAKPRIATYADAMRDVDDSGRLLDIEWCNRRILARIHRLTLTRLRREIEPVSAAALMRFLLRWQRLARGSQVIGADGLIRIVEQLEGYETAAGAWEREILPARLHGYDPTWLDQLCLGGHLMWCRMSKRKKVVVEEGEPSGETRYTPGRSAPLTFLLRTDAAWLRAPAALRDDTGEPDEETGEPKDLSDGTLAVWRRLAAGGAQFLADLVDATGLPPDAVEEALWELVAAGLATADGFASLRVLVDRRRGETRSHFDGVSAGHREPMSPAKVRKWLDAVKQARTRDHKRPGHATRTLPTAAGRWSLLGPPRADALDVERSARLLLARYGVVFRDLLVRESNLPPWRDLAMVYRRLEARGEIRGGRFANGFVGEQFALPEAVDELRAVRHPGHAAELVRVPATDPCNLVGVLSPGPRVPAIVGNAVLYKDGVAIASLEGGEVRPRAELEPGAHFSDDLVYVPPAKKPPAPAQVTLAALLD